MPPAPAAAVRPFEELGLEHAVIAIRPKPQRSLLTLNTLSGQFVKFQVCAPLYHGRKTAGNKANKSGGRDGAPQTPRCWLGGARWTAMEGGSESHGSTVSCWSS